MNNVLEKGEREKDRKFYIMKGYVLSVLFVEVLIARRERDRE